MINPQKIEIMKAATDFTMIIALESSTPKEKIQLLESIYLMMIAHVTDPVFKPITCTSGEPVQGVSAS